ncbi:DNA replication and repair protein RecF [Thermaerobacter marianensis DSM 12885]|uniref:DNA replication and repair protein RecF n=1 Tax=Thermaerobacter marianensis (strain ATCC 700841 / DSM 12885 / JCM 10246 / 7p75a) TaxID=644966 RepID=E6SK04_THEM7|nr:DNA replication/repair protein RecF [Thermaerobacter marianensis]ADU50128.1 DNA replication and repair protein RecF [Thermaerobacter marianensis DSM 12885]
MVIRRVVLRQFRSYERATLELEPGLTLLVGPNGIGKTNLLEAIHFAATGRSPRTSRDADLIRNGEPVCYVRVEWDDPVAGRRAVEMAYHREQGKALRLDGRKRRRVADLHGALPVVYFAPESLALVKAGPAARRDYLDRLLVQVVPGYGPLLHDYQRVLAQRNQLLREIRAGRAAASLLAIWDEPLLRHGTALRRHRQALLDELAPLVAAAAARVEAGGAVGPGEVKLGYLAGDGPGDAAHEPGREEPSGAPEEAGDPGQRAAGVPPSLAAWHREEIARGTTLWGPQRDDFAILLDGRDARAFASQGQQRALALALTLAEVHLIHRRLGRWPVLLLDDVLSELDARRRRHLLETVAGLPQVIVTATDEPAWPEGMTPRVVPLPLPAAGRPGAAAPRGVGP